MFNDATRNRAILDALSATLSNDVEELGHLYPELAVRTIACIERAEDVDPANAIEFGRSRGALRGLRSLWVQFNINRMTCALLSDGRPVTEMRFRR